MFPWFSHVFLPILEDPSDAALVRDGEGVPGAHCGGAVQGHRTRARGEGARAWRFWGTWSFQEGCI